MGAAVSVVIFVAVVRLVAVSLPGLVAVAWVTVLAIPVPITSIWNRDPLNIRRGINAFMMSYSLSYSLSYWDILNE